VLGATVALSTLLLLSACKRTVDRPPISREEYVEAYVEILQATDEEPDSVAASRRAQEILDRRGITQEELLGYAKHYAEDPEYLAQVWQEIESRLSEPEPQDSSEVEEDVDARAVDSRARSDGR